MFLSFLENFIFSRYWDFHEEVFAPRHLVGMLHALLPQLCLTLCNPMDSRPPGSSVHGFSRQEYWGGSPCPPPGDLHDPGIEPSSRVSPALQVGSSPTVPLGKPSKTPYLGVKRVLHVMHSSHREVSGRSWPSCCVNLKPGQRGFPLGQKDSHKFARDAGRIYLRDELFGSFPYK